MPNQIQPNIQVHVDGYGIIQVSTPVPLIELKKIVSPEEDRLVPIVGALYNNRIMGLEYVISRDCTVKFITPETEEGASIYRKSLSILLHASFIDTFGDNARLKIEHSLNRGYFYSYIGGKSISADMVERIERAMNDMVDNNLPFEKIECEKEEALDIFRNIGAWDRYYLLKYSDRIKPNLYRLGDCINLAQGPVVPSTGYLKLFALTHYPPGLVLTFPQQNSPDRLSSPLEQKKLFQIYSEQREWSKILDVDSAGKLNRLIIERKIDDLIWVSEGLHEKKISQIADYITKHIADRRIILLAGPSSSGKTTFAKRLTIQLLANGIKPEVVSLDSYYLPRQQMPRDEYGNINFESLYALDVDLINKHIKKLLGGNTVEVPCYDFKTGESVKGAASLKLKKNQIIIFEGIHGMNENLTSMIDREAKLKIYISALTQLNIDYINRIPTAMIRLIRRIVRDFSYRAYSAKQTLVQWPQVRRGEDQNIFPYQEEADIMFNSSLVYEMSVLKGYVEPLLKQIEDTEPVYTQAKRLLHFTSNFLFITPECVPPTSILREFIGGSGFQY
jgi:uridine kinase